jgi:polyisoprenoid-binding protein YceI
MTTATQIPGYVTGTWDIDVVHSDIEFSVRHFGVGKARGRFDTFSGEIVTADDLAESSVTASIDTASVNTGHGDRDTHLRSSDFFDVDTYPTASFRSTGIREDGDDYIIDGELTLHGVTKAVSLEVELGGFTDTENGGKLLGLSASTTLNRTEFGVGPEGGAVLGEKVKLTLEVEAHLRG